MRVTDRTWPMQRWFPEMSPTEASAALYHVATNPPNQRRHLCVSSPSALMRCCNSGNEEERSKDPRCLKTVDGHRLRVLPPQQFRFFHFSLDCTDYQL